MYRHVQASSLVEHGASVARSERHRLRRSRTVARQRRRARASSIYAHAGSAAPAGPYSLFSGSCDLPTSRAYALTIITASPRATHLTVTIVAAKFFAGCSSSGSRRRVSTLSTIPTPTSSPVSIQTARSSLSASTSTTCRLYTRSSLTRPAAAQRGARTTRSWTCSPRSGTSPTRA